MLNYLDNDMARGQETIRLTEHSLDKLDRKNCMQKIEHTVMRIFRDKIDITLTFVISGMFYEILFHWINECPKTIESAIGVC